MGSEPIYEIPQFNWMSTLTWQQHCHFLLSNLIYFCLPGSFYSSCTGLLVYQFWYIPTSGLLYLLVVCMDFSFPRNTYIQDTLALFRSSNQMSPSHWCLSWVPLLKVNTLLVSLTSFNLLHGTYPFDIPYILPFFFQFALPISFMRKNLLSILFTVISQHLNQGLGE